MIESKSKFIRDAAGIAKAIGVRLYAQRNQKLVQLEKIRELTALKDFPAKIKGLWPRAAVLEWANQNIRINGDCRNLKLKIKPAAAERGAPLRVPENQPPSGPGDLFDTANAKERRYASHREAWADGKPPKYFKQFPPEELLLAGIPRDQLFNAGLLGEKNSDSAGTIPRDCNSITEVAAMLNLHFRALGHAVDVRKQFVSDWRQGKRLPTGVPLFPPPDPLSNRYKSAECIEWYAKYILRNANGSAATRDLGLNLIDERDKAELEEIGHQRFLREKELGNYIRVDVAQGCIAGIFQTIIGARDKFIEDKPGVRRLVQEHAAACGISPEQSLALDARLAAALIKANDALKSADASECAALEKQIEELKQANTKI